jgi:hypothetical protein
VYAQRLAHFIGKRCVRRCVVPRDASDHWDTYEAVRVNQIVFHTDVTKVLAADSYLVRRFSPDLSTLPPADPTARKDFLDIVEVITNDTLVQYRPAPNQIGALSLAIGRVSRETESTRPPVFLPVRDDSRIAEDAERSLPFFVPLTRTRLSFITRLAKWVRFQVSTSYLQSLFWSDNHEHQLKSALDVYRHRYSTDTPLIRAGVHILGKHPLGYARDKLSTPWSAADFLVAYAFWAFIKGCRFAGTLNEDDVYVVHWLRRRAISDSDGAKKRGLKDVGGRIPWGGIVRHQLTSLRSDASMTPLPEALKTLRRYSYKRS